MALPVSTMVAVHHDIEIRDPIRNFAGAQTGAVKEHSVQRNTKTRSQFFDKKGKISSYRQGTEMCHLGDETMG